MRARSSIASLSPRNGTIRLAASGKTLSTPRGTMALQRALRRMAEEKAKAAAKTKLAAGSTSEPVDSNAVASPTISTLRREAARWWLRWILPCCNRWTATAAGLVLAMALIWGADGQWRTRRHGPGSATVENPHWIPRTARDWWRQARQRADDGDFRLALGAVRHAIALSSLDPVLLTFEGNMHESLYQFREAQASYEQALSVNPDYRPARQSLAVCRRINRRRDGTLRPGTLYSLHRTMLAQGRIVEALAVAQRLKDDRDLQRATWQAALDETGLAGTITVDATGAMELDLSGVNRPDLSLIHAFPLAGLKLSDTGTNDLHPLQGMALRTLDISRTPVYDLEPLRGMPLQSLRMARTGVVDLAPLAGNPLRVLDITGTKVVWIDPLKGLPLEDLRADDTRIADLRPLAALPLRELSLRHTRAVDLQPLTHLGLQTLALDGTAVVDLSPLAHGPLRELSLAFTAVKDLRPLATMPLESLTLTGCPEGLDLSPLAACTALEHLALPPRPKGLDLVARLTRLHFIHQDHPDSDARALARNLGTGAY